MTAFQKIPRLINKCLCIVLEQQVAIIGIKTDEDFMLQSIAAAVPGKQPVKVLAEIP